MQTNKLFKALRTARRLATCQPSAGPLAAAVGAARAIERAAQSPAVQEAVAKATQRAGEVFNATVAGAKQACQTAKDVWDANAEKRPISFFGGLTRRAVNAYGTGINVVQTATGTRFYYRGMGFRGGYGSPWTVAGKQLFSGALGAAKWGAGFSVLQEGYNQWRKGEFKPSKLVATAATGALKGVLAHGAQVGAAALVAAGIAAAGLTAPAWVPIAAGVVVGTGVAMGLNYLDDKYHITDRLAEGISSVASHAADGIGNAASKAADGIGNAANKAADGIRRLFSR